MPEAGHFLTAVNIRVLLRLLRCRESTWLHGVRTKPVLFARFFLMSQQAFGIVTLFQICRLCPKASCAVTTLLEKTDCEQLV